jgi:hypothetical protein
MLSVSVFRRAFLLLPRGWDASVSIFRYKNEFVAGLDLTFVLGRLYARENSYGRYNL